MRILDATASNRSMWYQKSNPFTTFLDKRCGKEYQRDKLNPAMKFQRVIRIFPDIQADWQHLPFINECFDIVVFDPPHLFKDKGKKLSAISKRYGIFYNYNWKQVFRDSIIELFRTLKSEGIFIFKWSSVEVDITEPLKLFPQDPLFGTRTGQRNNTHWICFIKSKQNKELSEFE